MQAITLEMILRVVFGLDRGPGLTAPARADQEAARRDDAAVGAAYRRCAATSGRCSPWARFLAVREAVDDALYEEIARRRDDPSELAERTDIFSLLMQARDEDGEPLTDRELRDELITLLIAGHETTATGAGLGVRADRAGAGRARAARGDDDYAEAAVHETLRLRPPIPVVARRVVNEPFMLGSRHDPRRER